MFAESLVLIIDRLMSLLKTREENKKKIFDGFIEPLFKEAEQAFNDYRRFLVSVRALLRSDRPLSKTDVSEIEGERNEQANLRLKLCMLSGIYAVSSDRSMREFFETLEQLFSPSQDGARTLSRDLFLYQLPSGKKELESEIEKSALKQFESLGYQKDVKFNRRGKYNSEALEIVNLIGISARLQNEVQPDPFRIYIIKQIDLDLEDCEIRWSRFCSLYGNLRLKMTMPS